MTETYPRLFADVRRSCFIPVATNAKGVVDARIPFDEESAPDFEPLFLLVADGSVVACSARALMGFDSAGTNIWRREIRYRRPVQIRSGRVYFLAPDTMFNVLSAIGLDGSPVDEKMIILDTDRESGPIYIEPGEDGFIAHCLYILGAEDGGPEMIFYKKAYATREYRWVLNLMDQAILPPLHIHANHRYVVFGEHETFVYDTSPNAANFSLVTQFRHPLQEVREVSAGADNTLNYLGSGSTGLELVVTDLSGQVAWRWSPIDATSLPAGVVQPPAAAERGRIIVSTGKKVAAVAGGSLVWEFSPVGGVSVRHLTALAGGTVLVTAGKRLYALTSAGKILFRVDFEETLRTPPVVDHEGTIYVAGPRILYRVK